jgi:hypothetical protein
MDVMTLSDAYALGNEAIQAPPFLGRVLILVGMANDLRLLGAAIIAASGTYGIRRAREKTNDAVWS